MRASKKKVISQKPAIRKVVFIISFKHSGSTLLGFLLGANKDCFNLGEFTKAKERQKTLSKKCLVCDNYCKLWAAFKRNLKTTTKRHLYEAAFETFKKPILIDTSRKWAWVKSASSRINCESKIIFLTRNERDRLSFHQRFGDGITRAIVERQARGVTRTKRWLKNRKYLQVKYENVCNKNALKRCCKFIGIEYDEKMFRYWETLQHALEGNSRTASLMKKWHNLSIGNPTALKFIEEHGLKVKAIKSKEKWTKKEKKVFTKYGGANANKLLGYKEDGLAKKKPVMEKLVKKKPISYKKHMKRVFKVAHRIKINKQAKKIAKTKKECEKYVKMIRKQ